MDMCIVFLMQIQAQEGKVEKKYKLHVPELTGVGFDSDWSFIYIIHVPISVCKFYDLLFLFQF